MKTKWHKFKFIVTPEEFKSVFNDLVFYFPITNTRVAVDYKIEDTTSIFDKYTLFYKKVISGEKWEKEDWKLNIYASITDNTKYIGYKAFEIEEDALMNSYKRPIILEPVINISPFTLYVDAKERLSVQYSDRTHNSNIGFEFSYPKNFSIDSEFMSTEEFSTYQLYLKLIKSIKSLSKKAKVERKNETVKPNFWISNPCIDAVNNGIALKQNNLKLI